MQQTRSCINTNRHFPAAPFILIFVGQLLVYLYLLPLKTYRYNTKKTNKQLNNYVHKFYWFDCILLFVTKNLQYTSNYNFFLGRSNHNKSI